MKFGGGTFFNKVPLLALFPHATKRFLAGPSLDH